MSLEGVLLDCEGSIAYYKESIHILESGECHILYKFFFEMKELCDIHIFLPFKIEGVTWKQENIRNQEYVEKQAAARGHQKIGEDVFSYEIDDVGKFNSYIPENRIMEEITEISSFRSIHIKMSKITLEREFFKGKNFFLCIMFKITTMNFLSEKTMKKLSKNSQYWDFNVFIYPIITSISKKEREKFPLIKYADIWAVLPENTTPLYMHPPLKDIIKIEKEDEERARQFAKGEPKLLKEGRIAIVWEIRDIKAEKSIFFKGGTEKFLIDEIKNDLREEIEKMVKEVTSNNIEELKNEIKMFKEKTVTWEGLLAIIIAIIGIFATLVVSLVK